MAGKILITDLIGKTTLDRVQSSYTGFSGLSAAIEDTDHNIVTAGENYITYCGGGIRTSSLGCDMCHKCVEYSAKQTIEKGKIVPFYCHAGLLEFTAPIVVNNEIIGYFCGGQVLDHEPVEEEIRAFAEELSLDGDALWSAASQIPVRSIEEISKMSEFLYSLTEALSNMAKGRYMAKAASEELARAAQIKEDFLANMSHEIRTPMNAVIGIAEMVTRENLSPSARDFIEQIKSSSKALLNIVNDLLDYSKIESGQLSIVDEEYEPMTLVSEVSTIIMSRLMQKTVELLVDMPQHLPKGLVGDSQRIRQILINLANNAVKFTNEGYIKVIIDYDWIGDEEIMLKIAVEDTGMGIKQEDIGKLFGAFSQVNQEKTRNIEGTGLGLSIVKNFVKLMNGSVGVRSEYGKGSVFHFEIPQKVYDKSPSVEVPTAKDTLFAGFLENDSVAEDLRNDSDKIGVEFIRMIGDGNPIAVADELVDKYEDKDIYVMVEQPLFRREIMELMDLENPKYSRVHIVLLANAFADLREWRDIEELSILKKPLSVLNLGALVNNDDTHMFRNRGEVNTVSFVAPEARVLLVDDNAINLTVAEGLMQPMLMKVDKALSGKEALEMIEKNDYDYDLIFMDHMMPEMDGVETTRVIRRFYSKYNEVPIIALTANAINGAKEMFLNEGMNDFIAKPIEIKILESKILQWLSPEKIKRMTTKEVSKLKEELDYENKVIIIGDLDTANARKNFDDDDAYLAAIKNFCESIEDNSKRIQKCLIDEDWPAYITEVHALKNEAHNIGAKELFNMLNALEKAGNARNIVAVKRDTTYMLNKYMDYGRTIKETVEKLSR